MANIFLNYDADALEREYLPVHWPDVNLQAAIDEWVERGEAYHQKADVEPDIPYGDTGRQCLDLLHPEKANAPVLVFIHGGYWRNKVLNKRSYGFCAEPLVNAGALVAMIEYELCPEVTIDTIVAQVQKACAWLWRNVAEHGGDPTRIHVSGHSAGGHLTAMMGTTDWPALGDDLPGVRIRTAAGDRQTLRPFVDRLVACHASWHPRGVGRLVDRRPGSMVAAEAIGTPIPS